MTMVKSANTRQSDNFRARWRPSFNGGDLAFSEWVHVFGDEELITALHGRVADGESSRFHARCGPMGGGQRQDGCPTLPALWLLASFIHSPGPMLQLGWLSSSPLRAAP
jgi:hypothetical protein